MAKKKVITRKKTPFNHIYIIQDQSVREMWFKGERDFFLQTRMDLDHPDSIPMAYPQLMLAALLIKPNPQRILVIGLGGGHLPRQMTRIYPETRVDVVEIDPEVIHLAKRYFLFEESSHCKCFAMDGRVFIKQQRGKVIYDIVWLDAFKSGSVPYHLKTSQFYEEIRQVLIPDGVVGSNLYGKSNAWKPHDLKTFNQIFKYEYGFEDPERIATALLATNGEPKWLLQDFIASAQQLDAYRSFPAPLKEVALLFRPELFDGKVAFVLKDEFRPSEFMKAVKKNNLDNNKEARLYSIASLHPEES